ncbi:hypothetical protein phi1422_0015 [Bdellovibrio phage phi1422]|uniref:hypothetical protein n=1 Tax=Bdellovibrio phage phi1422 TaxID=1127515 RepID=UPI0002536D0E|nr:hypothetical protein F395_gp15 [Bdellovibrio phage phi1422]AFC22535.1 hypothetical protein phi1422_0015 [Bdellovibrio phage phi1422]
MKKHFKKEVIDTQILNLITHDTTIKVCAKVIGDNANGIMVRVHENYPVTDDEKFKEDGYSEKQYFLPWHRIHCIENTLKEVTVDEQGNIIPEPKLENKSIQKTSRRKR